MALDYKTRHKVAVSLNTALRGGVDAGVTSARLKAAAAHSQRRNSAAHLVDQSVAAWVDGRAFIGARAVCGEVFRVSALATEFSDICERCAVAVPPADWYVYRFFDAQERLLYIGCTGSLLNRIADHQRNSRWFRTAVRMTQQSFADKGLAFAFEAAAIRAEQPIHNVNHKVA